MALREIIFGVPNTPQPDDKLGNVVRIEEDRRNSETVFYIQLDDNNELRASLNVKQKLVRGIERVGDRVWIDEKNLPVLTTLDVHTRRQQ